jgi:hypothetical protein
LAALACGGDPQGGSGTDQGTQSPTHTGGSPNAAMPSASSAGGGDAAAAPSSPVDAGQDSGYRDPRPVDGGCAPPNLLCPNGDAGSTCVAADQDENNCGACGKVCTGPTAICLSGQCGCSGLGLAYCMGTGCMDVTSDTNNCGACGNVCDPNQFTACQNGTCVP